MDDDATVRRPWTVSSVMGFGESFVWQVLRASEALPPQHSASYAAMPLMVGHVGISLAVTYMLQSHPRS